MLLFIVMVLLCVGILMVFSASPTMAMRLGDSYYYLKRHIMAAIIGISALYLGLKMDYYSLRAWANYLMLIAVIFLLIVLLPSIGVGAGGANRWIYIGLISFQPAELAKLALILFLAAHLTDNKDENKTFNFRSLQAFGIVLISILLVFKEPDLGTAIIIAMISFAVFFLAGTAMKYIRYVVAAGIAGILALSIITPYRMKRLAAYINPWNDPRGVGFHIIQSLIAVGSGGLFGVGLGQSKQKFFYLPQNYTDFIFAIFCEEMGLIGAIGVVLLFFFFISRGIRIIRNSPDAFSMLLAGGIVFWIGFQAFVNMSVVLGVLPTTGIPLPFISYGGTSLVMTLFSVGILLNISQYRLAKE